MRTIDFNLIQRELVNQVNPIIEGYDCIISEVEGDILYIFNKGKEDQFTMEICYDNTEFFSASINKWFDASNPNYISSVLLHLKQLLR